MKYIIIFLLLAAITCSCSKSDPTPAARIVAKVQYHFTITAVDNKAFVATISTGVNKLEKTTQYSTASVIDGTFLNHGDELWIEPSNSNKALKVNIAADGESGSNYTLTDGVTFKFKAP